MHLWFLLGLGKFMLDIGGTTGIKFRSNAKGGQQALNFGQMVRGDHRH